MYKNKYVVFLALVFVIYVTFRTGSIAQSQNDSPPEKTTPWYVNQNPKEKKLALERYQFLFRVGSHYGIDITSTMEQGGYAIFPFRRADRMYALLHDMYINGNPVEKFYCFQRKDGKDKLVYMLNLYTKRSHYRKIKKINNLMNYIYSKHCEIKGKINHYVKKDLTKISNYVVYSHMQIIDQLRVFMISDNDNEKLVDKIYKEPLYVDRDPYSKKNMEVYQFFKTYGLPILPAELKEDTK